MMSKNNRPRSWKEMRDRRANQNSFVGREAQLKAFQGILNTPYDQRNKVISNISGQGGIGKTTLLKQFREISEASNCVTAYVDEGSQSNPVDNVPEVLYRLSLEFAKKGHKFEKFQERYKVYRQKQQELEADPDAPQGFASGVGRVLIKAGLGAAKSIPGSSTVLNLIEPDALANKSAEWLEFITRKLTNKDEVQLIREPLEILTPLFLEELNRIPENQTVVFLLDTYEQTGLFLDDWLRSLLDGRYGELRPNFLMVIAGRDFLNRNLWADLESWIARSELEPFTPGQARQYLTERGITNEAVIDEIWRLSSGGLPLLIGMMAQVVPTSVDLVTDVCEDAVERFLKWEEDKTKRQLSLNAALPRILNRDILALFVDEAAVNDLFEWLKGRSFVVEHTEGWQYHNIVREQMLRYQLRISPKEWEKQHTQLAEYYDVQRKALGLTDALQQKNRTWQKYTLEWLYHSLCASSSQQIAIALNGWLMALDIQKFAGEWAETMKMAGAAINSEGIKLWSDKFLNALQNLEQNKCDDMLEVLSDLLREPCLEDKCRANALVGLAMFPFQCLISEDNNSQFKWKIEDIPDLNRVIEVLNQAITLAPDIEEYLVFRGIIYLLKGCIDEANLDFNRVLQLDKIDNELKEQIKAITIDIDFQYIENLKQIFPNQDLKQVNLFEITQKLEEEHQRKEQEIYILEQEVHKKNREIQRLEEKSVRRKELAKKIRKLMSETHEQRQESHYLSEENVNFTEECEKVRDFIHKSKAEIKKLVEEIQIKKKDFVVNKEDIYKLQEKLKITSDECQKVAKEFQRLIEEDQEREQKIQELWVNS
ncbi:MAG: hypothetical protein KME64_41600 [Scytonematopsis contorta HA4267-MV1]|jgi:hypothetical protein|nr:hypothetical protein [Scytonematopsis contorta HA4267-MV1]